MSDTAPGLTDSPTFWVAVAGIIGAAVTGFWSWVSGRNSSVAVLQTALTQGFKELNEQQMDTITSLREEVKELRICTVELQGQIRAEEQRNIALKNLLRAHGIDIPRDTVHVTVFSPYPEQLAPGETL